MGMFDIFDVIDGKAEIAQPEEKPVKKRGRKKKEAAESEKVQNELQSEGETNTQEEMPFGMPVVNIESETPEDENTTMVTTTDAQLTFLENPITNHVLIGRKKSVFNKYGEEAALYIGRVNEQDYEQREIYFDSLDPQVVFVCGSRGSGKSYVIGVFAEELALKNKNVGMVVIDPVGVFWSMKYPNREEREVKLLAEYGLEPKGLDNVFVFIPEGAKAKTPRETYDATFTLQPGFLTAEDWSITFGIDRFSPIGLLLEKVLKKVEEGYRTLDGLIFRGKGANYDINDLIFCMENDSEINSKERGFRKESVRALVSRFEAAKSWGIFSKTGTPLIEISVPGQLTIIDVSFLDENVSALLVGILARRILAARKISTRTHAASKVGSESNGSVDHDIPPTWLFIDEAHTLIPGGGILTPASKALIEYVKQGRQPGCSLIFATQQPSAIDAHVLSQVGTLLTYKLVFDDDIKAVFKRMPTIVPKKYKDPGFIKKLEIGIPLIADRVETTSRAFVAAIRPRMSQHEGRETQTAEIKHKMTKDEVLATMVIIGKNKLMSCDELDVHGIETLLKILNMKYKTEFSFDMFANALLENGVVFENDKYFVRKNEDEMQEMYEEKIVYKTIDADVDEKQIEGVLKRNLGWNETEIKKVFRPIFRVNYKVYGEDGSFVSDICFVDPVAIEFLHFIDNRFVYSEGLNYIRLFDADDINILMRLPLQKGFDVDWLKETTGFSEIKLKRAMDRLMQVGLIRKEKRGIKNVYFLLKNIEIPKKPLLKILGSVDGLLMHDVEVLKGEILEPRISTESLRNLLGILWGNIKIDEIETILREEFMVTNLITKETAMFDAVTGKKV